MNKGLQYPLSVYAKEKIRTNSGKSLDDITLESVLEGKVTSDDLTITSDALKLQAEIAKANGRRTLAQNFERAAELVNIPQEMILSTYEMLRPGRSTAKDLKEQAIFFLENYNAKHIAALLNEAAEIYEKRGIFRKRF